MKKNEMKNNKILMLSQTIFPPDIRLEKEIKSLTENGYQVLVLCNQYEKGKNLEFEYCKIIRVNAPFKTKKFNKIVNFPIFFNPRYLIKLIRAALTFKPDFIHAHDMPMVPLGFIIKKMLRIPLIYDMHENYPDALREFKKKGLSNFLFKNPSVADYLEKFNLKVADIIITVVSENRHRLIEKGVQENKIKVVSNTIDLETFVKSGSKVSEDKRFIGKEIIVYTGTVSSERGLETPIGAMKLVRKEIPNAVFIIVGDGPLTSTLKNIIEQNGLNENVLLIPWCGHHNLWKFINLAKICIIPQPSNNFIDNTIPHKIFEYMSFEKPVLVSDAKPLKRIICETECGLYFRSYDEEDCASKLIKLLKKNNLNEFGLKGKKAVEKKYNWKIDAKVLVDIYNSFSKK